MSHQNSFPRWAGGVAVCLGLCTGAALIAQQSDVESRVVPQRGIVHVNLPKLSLEGATRNATDVVYAQVLSAEVEALAGGMPARVYELHVMQSVRGAFDSTVHVTVAGGIDEVGRELIVPGAPVLEPGSLAVLFLFRDGNGTVGISGLGQGHYPVLGNGEAAVVTGPHALEDERVSNFLQRIEGLAR